MSFNIGLSGLRAAQMDLSVTGNNIANASTVGFKQSRAEFGDVYSASILGTGRHSTGSGVLVERVSQQHTQGNINYTDRALDMAIEGNGYFILSNNGQVEYTRAGYFNLDKDGFIINNTGKRLQGYTADDQGNVQGVMGDMRLSQTNIEPKATGRLDLEFNFDSRKADNVSGLRAQFDVTMNGADLTQAVTVGTDPLAAAFNPTTGVYTGPGTMDIGGVTYNVVAAGPGRITLTEPGNVGAGLTAAPTPLTNASLVSGSFTAAVPESAPAAGDGSGASFTLQVAPLQKNLTVDGATFAAVFNPSTSSYSVANAVGIKGTNYNVETPDTANPLNLRLVAADPGPVNAVVTGSTAGDVAAAGGFTQGTLDLRGFNPNDRTTYSDQNPTKVYDSLGIEHVVSQYFIKIPAQDSSAGNAWSMIVAFDGKFVDGNGNAVEHNGAPLTAANFNDWVTGGGDPTSLAQKTIYFNTQGSLVGYNNGFQPNNTAIATQSPTFDISIPDDYLDGAWIGPTQGSNNTFSYNLRGTTQYGAAFSAQSQSQDGYTTGRLAGLEVGADGSIFGRYTNGQNKVVGQVPIATFTNPEGLRPNGSTAWLESPDSGIPTINVAGTGITGTIAGGALEDSNVDLAEELVKMIIGQRNYQANAKTIQTQDTITQTIINLR